MLSIPRTISSVVNVTNATHASGLVSHSNIHTPHSQLSGTQTFYLNALPVILLFSLPLILMQRIDGMAKCSDPQLGNGNRGGMEITQIGSEI
jgi:hypothetical protein